MTFVNASYAVFNGFCVVVFLASSFYLVVLWGLKVGHISFSESTIGCPLFGLSQDQNYTAESTELSFEVEYRLSTKKGRLYKPCGEATHEFQVVLESTDLKDQEFPLIGAYKSNKLNFNETFMKSGALFDCQGKPMYSVEFEKWLSEDSEKAVFPNFTIWNIDHSLKNSFRSYNGKEKAEFLASDNKTVLARVFRENEQKNKKKFSFQMTDEENEEMDERTLLLSFGIWAFSEERDICHSTKRLSITGAVVCGSYTVLIGLTALFWHWFKF